LYTQQENWVFGLSQACQNLENLMSDFLKNQHPFEKWKGNFDSEIERYNRLEQLLARISPRDLTSKGEEARQKCVDICAEIKDRLSELQQEIHANDERYEQANARITDMMEYNTSRFDEIRHRVLMAPDRSFFKIIGTFGSNLRTFTDDLKTVVNRSKSTSKSVKRENRTMFWTGIGAFILAMLLSFVFLWKVLPKINNKKLLSSKRSYFLTVLALGLFLIIMSVCVSSFMSGYFTVSSLKIILEYLLILEVVMLSIGLRVDNADIHLTLKMYLPILLAALLFILERVALVSNHIVTFTFPLILAGSAIWQSVLMAKHAKDIEKEDKTFLSVTLVVTAAAWLISWAGYHFIALMLTSYWVIQLTAFQAVGCLKYFLAIGKKNRRKNSTREIWLEPTTNKLLIPVLYIASFVFSFRWAAEIFSMRSWADDILSRNFAEVDGGFTASLLSILLIVALVFAFNWITFIVKAVLKAIYKDSYAKGPIPLYVTIGTIFIWFIFAILATKILGIDSRGLIAAIGGMGVGIGFALKDTIEDLFCGISLLMGRVHLNDIIECDGIRGKITDIGIRSTTVETLDGSIISFLNSQLFAKNFKNLTKNNKYELCSVAIGVSYGTNVNEARNIIIEALKPLSDIFAPNKEPSVQLIDFGESSVDLAVKIWVSTRDKSSHTSMVREAIYDAFNRNGIEIPFPQRDIHIKED
ncbi:MAG: mechanosensitive ion channel family protein, partial [Bacteroidales bacterium]|nr:mechanosensitive ion channel family protein [Bacteroidales bacterium]